LPRDNRNILSMPWWGFYGFKRKDLLFVDKTEHLQENLFSPSVY
jgi:hypothetical protein